MYQIILEIEKHRVDYLTRVNDKPTLVYLGHNEYEKLKRFSEAFCVFKDDRKFVDKVLDMEVVQVMKQSHLSVGG